LEPLPNIKHLRVAEESLRDNGHKDHESRRRKNDKKDLQQIEAPRGEAQKRRAPAPSQSERARCGHVGVHIEGLLADVGEWEWTFALKPHRVTIEAPGWTVSGIRPDGVPEQQVFFARKEKSHWG